MTEATKTCHDGCCDDQPDGICGQTSDMPEPAAAAQRVRDFVSEWGDGEVMEGLYARDLEALTRAAKRAQMLEDTALELLGRINEPGHPGRPCMRSGWLSVDYLAAIRRRIERKR